MLTTGFARFPEIEEHSRRSIDAMARLEGRSDQPEQSSVFFSSVGDRVVQPGVIAATSDPQGVAHRLDVVLLAMCLDERVYPSCSPRGGSLRHLAALRFVLPAVLACPRKPGNSNLVGYRDGTRALTARGRGAHSGHPGQGFQAQANRLSITGTDLEVELVAATKVGLEQPGDITVPGRKLVDIFRALPHGVSVTLSTEGERAIVRAGRSRLERPWYPIARSAVESDRASP
jgi:DNA polymerase III beta subunit, N-terminal domain